MWIKRSTFEELIRRIKDMKEAVDNAYNLSYLTSIEREGRKTVFTFSRRGQIIKVETMSLISDNLPQWKEELLR